jgi:hypothetical protein
MKNPPWSFSGREPGRASKSLPGAGFLINTNSDERQFTKIYRPPIAQAVRLEYFDSAIRPWDH